MSRDNENRSAPTSRDRDGARKNAQNHFAASEQRNTLIRQEIAKERASVDAKTAKLRALRLAKEEEERVAAENAPKPVAKKRAVAKPRVKKAG
jgi:hypothetical protein